MRRTPGKRRDVRAGEAMEVIAELPRNGLGSRGSSANLHIPYLHRVDPEPTSTSSAPEPPQAGGRVRVVNFHDRDGSWSSSQGENGNGRPRGTEHSRGSSRNPTSKQPSGTLNPVEDVDKLVDDEGLWEETEPLDMWTRKNVGLYAHYAMTGLLIGLATRPSTQICRAGFFDQGDLSDDVLQFFCDNLTSLALIPWNLKFFISLITDSCWPAGYRRKPFMVVGWLAAIGLIVFLSFRLEHLTPPEYTYWLLCVMIAFQFANVPADGYSVQLAIMGMDGSTAKRGSILLTGQIVRFGSGIITNFIHGFLFNGQELNPGAPLAWNQAWGWSITLQQYYITIIVLLVLLFIPILMLEEIKDEKAHRRSLCKLLGELWNVLSSKAAFRLIGYGILTNAFARTTNLSINRLQYSIIKIPILLDGVEGMAVMGALTLGVMAFRNNLMYENWRKLNLYSRLMFLVYTTVFWIMCYYNFFGLRNGWFTVFIVVTSTFISGLTQNLISLPIIEIARPGIEASVYQLIVSVSNSCITVGGILGNQLFKALVGDSIDTSGLAEFDSSGGPWGFARYTLILGAISAIAIVLSSQLMPVDRSMFQYWERQSRMSGKGAIYGKVSLAVSFLFMAYGVCVSIFYFFPELACNRAVGGSGCEDMMS